MRKNLLAMSRKELNLPPTFHKVMDNRLTLVKAAGKKGRQKDRERMKEGNYVMEHCTKMVYLALN